MSPTCLYRETKSTKVITTSLYDHEFPCEEFSASELFEVSYFGLHHGAPLFWCHGKVIRVFGKYLYLVLVSLELRIYFKKPRVDNAISDITTA